MILSGRILFWHISEIDAYVLKHQYSFVLVEMNANCYSYAHVARKHRYISLYLLTCSSDVASHTMVELYYYFGVSIFLNDLNEICQINVKLISWLPLVDSDCCRGVLTLSFQVHICDWI